MKTLCAFILMTCIFLSSPALAETIPFTWNKPTLDGNGDPLNGPTELTGYKLYISQTPGSYNFPVATVTTEAATYTQSIRGRYYVIVKAYNAAGESGPSNEVTFDISLKPPGAPINLKITPRNVLGGN